MIASSCPLLRLALLLLSPLLINGVRAQSTFVQQAQDQAIRTYEQRLQGQAHAQEGHLYVGHDPRIKIHPYFQTDSLQRGTVQLNGVRYRDLQLLYDVVRDQVVIQPTGSGYRLQVPMEKMASFSLGNSQFTWINGDSLAGVRTGFYEVIYNGRVKALAKRVKTIEEDLYDGSYKGKYLIKDKFIVQKQNAFFEIKTKRSFLKLFPDQARELRRFIRKNALRFSADRREQAIAQATQRYDELTRGL
ncbi:hypothetical protein ACAW74_03490 [Fibrella sp. WM1]|uniref:hypothetical protein n=1 Tax=Fibrella musci TaxID=3242485 RepID=UPI003522B16F